MDELIFDVDRDEDRRLLAVGRDATVFADGDELRRNVQQVVEAFYFDSAKLKIIFLAGPTLVREKIELLASFDEARTSIARGEGVPITPESMRELTARVAERGRKRLLAERAPTT